MWLGIFFEPLVLKVGQNEPLSNAEYLFQSLLFEFKLQRRKIKPIAYSLSNKDTKNINFILRNAKEAWILLLLK